ncbi:MAG: hypothetical protein R2711_16720 [Acidimicrobiales bacterium]
MALGQAFRNFDPEALQTFSPPVTDVTRGGAAVLDLIVSDAEPILQMFRGTGQPVDPGELDPGSIPVKRAQRQRQAGPGRRRVGDPGGGGVQDAAAVLGRATEVTEVRYAPGQEAEAALVARHLFAQPVLIADPEVAQITVITGADFGAAVLEARPASDIPVPTTTTTALAEHHDDPARCHHRAGHGHRGGRRDDDHPAGVRARRRPAGRGLRLTPGWRSSQGARTTVERPTGRSAPHHRPREPPQWEARSPSSGPATWASPPGPACRTSATGWSARTWCPRRSSR